VYEVRPEWQAGEKEPKIRVRRISSQRPHVAMVAALERMSALGSLQP
jgi:hypothetical protein